MIPEEGSAAAPRRWSPGIARQKRQLLLLCWFLFS
jgi:hypothetical protein